MFLVDDKPIRAYKNDRARGVPFPTWQGMRVHGSLWNADEWATQGGRVKTDWTQAPFYAYYRNFRASRHRASRGAATSPHSPHVVRPAALRKVQEEYMVYDYCADLKRFKDEGLPVECTVA